MTKNSGVALGFRASVGRRAWLVPMGPVLLAVACSGVEPDASGEGDDGGEPSAGSSAAGAGGSAPVGGAASGGASGTGSGGAANGGNAANGGSGGTPGQGGASPMGGQAGSVTGGSAGMGGRASGGAAPGGTGGRGGAGGQAGSSAGSGAAAGSGGGPSSSCATWPSPSSTQSVSSTIQVSGNYDGMMRRYVGSGPLGTGGQQEGQSPIFELANGATLRNVILGNPAADGIHCQGSCTLENVWWEDVGEDAATFRGSSGSQQMTVRCGGARSATDKVFQHNGAGTLTIEDFTAENFNKLYRSCGNCSSQYARHVVLRDVTVRQGQVLVGVNTNYGDTADFERITVYGDPTICERYTGNNNGGEPVRTGQGPDSQYCRYENSDIIRP